MKNIILTSLTAAICGAIILSAVVINTETPDQADARHVREIAQNCRDTFPNSSNDSLLCLMRKTKTNDADGKLRPLN